MDVELAKKHHWKIGDYNIQGAIGNWLAGIDAYDACDHQRYGGRNPVGVISGLIPSYRASNLGIVDAIRHIG